MKVDPNASAYPNVITIASVSTDSLSYQPTPQHGIPIRLAIASQIMAGMIRDRSTSTPNSFFAGISLEWADALIAAHNEDSK